VETQNHMQSLCMLHNFMTSAYDIKLCRIEWTLSHSSNLVEIANKYEIESEKIIAERLIN